MGKKSLISMRSVKMETKTIFFLINSKILPRYRILKNPFRNKVPNLFDYRETVSAYIKRFLKSQNYFIYI